MKKLFLIIPFLFMSCHQRVINSIHVQFDRSTDVHLFEGLYTVHFMAKGDSTYNFSITEDEIDEIKVAYNNERIVNYGKQLLILDEESVIMPATDIKYTITFSDGSKQIFTVRTDFTRNPLDNEKYKNLKVFIEKIDKIIQSKKEIRNAPKSDVRYM